MVTTPGGRLSEAMDNIRMSESGILYTLRTVREPIVDYQEARGISRNE